MANALLLPREAQALLLANWHQPSKRRRIRVNTNIAYESVAVLTIKHADKMTARQRRQIAKWLADQAHALQTQGSHYSSRFRARYMSR